MPEFNKEEYSERRKAGERGQGPKHAASKLYPPSISTSVDQWKTEKKPGRYALRKNTKRARKAAAA
jgi:hypothetical protein